jgi:MFS transporter, DHA2 family, methylenomycin A resistance protein
MQHKSSFALTGAGAQPERSHDYDRRPSGECRAARGLVPASPAGSITTSVCSMDVDHAEFVAVIATGAAFFMIVLDTSVVNLAVPRIKDVFHADLASLQWLVDGYALVFASLLLNAGALGDRYGAKRVFSAGLLMFCAASAACGLAPNMASLQCARALQGISAAMLLPNSLASLNHTIVDPDRRKTAVSAWATAGALGVAVGPLVGGVLVQYLDWRSIFLVNVPVGLTAVWLARRHVASGPRQPHRGLDLVGQALAVATLAALTYWMISVGRSRAVSHFVMLLGLAVILLGCAFLAVESRQAKPMLPLDLLFRPALGSVAIVGLLHNVGIYGLIFALSLAFQELRGMTPVGAGLLFLPMTLALALGTRIGARLLRKSDPFGPQIWGHAASALGAVALSVVGFGHGLGAIAVPLCVIGLGGGITTPSMNLSALDAVERERSGLASGILNSARQTGGVIGVALLGSLVGGPATLAGASRAAVTAAVALAGASALAARIARQYRSSATAPVELER